MKQRRKKRPDDTWFEIVVEIILGILLFWTD